MSGMSKAEYLKKYMSDASDSKPKKRRKKVQNNVPAKKVIKSRIVDDDVGLVATMPTETVDPYAAEEEPTIADVIDERPKHIQQLEKYRNEKWKQLDTSQKSRHDSSSDEGSPVRRRRHDSDGDSSDNEKSLTGMRYRNDSDSDQSPNRHDSDSDQSPKRKQTARNDSDSDLSPARHKSDKWSSRVQNSDSDQSPVRNSRQQNSDSDQSPQRKRDYNSDSDQSPVRKSTEVENNKKATKTSSGAKAGLSSAKAMREEMEKLKRKEQKAFSAMKDSKTGKNAATVIRDKSGKIVDMHEEMKKDREKKQKDERYSKWSKGLKQQELQKESVNDLMHEMSKPLARYEDDEDLDASLKEQDRDGDPMLAFMKSKKKTKKGGTLPKYSGPAPPPNRFGIPPGYRWDGVDRYNGFEKKYFEQISAKKARSDAAFKWSTEDM